LERKLAGRSLFEVLDELYKGKDKVGSYGPVFSELYDKYGYLTYSEDRHSVEFFPHYITGDERKLKKYSIIRTSIEDRMKWMDEKTQLLQNYISGSEAVSDKFSGEAAAQIAGAVINRKDIIDVTNQPNIGQVPNLPKGTIVETPGVVNDLGFRPLCAGELPEPLLDLVMPHAVNQNLIAEAGLKGDINMALEALYNDPLCRHLKHAEVKEMGMKLIEANRQWMQQF
jgi:alpha-galactosidase